MGILTSYNAECDDCMDPLCDKSGEMIEHSSYGGIVQAAKIKGWWISLHAEQILCDACREEEGL